MPPKPNSKNFEHVQDVSKRFRRVLAKPGRVPKFTGVVPDKTRDRHQILLRLDRDTARLLTLAARKMKITIEHVIMQYLVESVIRDGWHTRYKKKQNFAERYEYDHGKIDTSSMNNEEYASLLARLRAKDDAYIKRVSHGQTLQSLKRKKNKKSCTKSPKKSSTRPNGSELP